MSADKEDELPGLFERMLERQRASIGSVGRRDASELVAGSELGEASQIFHDHERAHDEASLRQVEPVFRKWQDWAQQNHFPGVEADASWSLYLVQSRTNRLSEAWTSLQCVRRVIEEARKTIDAPDQRAEILGRFAQLFPAMVHIAHQLGRADWLFEAIEASKARVLADLLSIGRDQPAEAPIETPQTLRPLLAEHNAAYFTLFSSETDSYSALLLPDGRLHTKRLEIDRSAVEGALSIESRDPRSWDGILKGGVFARPKISTDRIWPLLDPLAASMPQLARLHLCVSPDDVYYPLPIHLMEVDGRAVYEITTVSRIPSAGVLRAVLSRPPSRPKQAISIVVPAKNDLSLPDKLAAMERAPAWLDARLPSKSLRQLDATPATVLAALGGNTGLLAHFASHGVFPEDSNTGELVGIPYEDAGVVLSFDGQLPDLGSGSRTRASLRHHLLSPKAVTRAAGELAPGHVTFQACVTGSARDAKSGEAIGMEWVFLGQGSNSLLLSLWNVDAESSAAFSVAFYQSWLCDRDTRAQAWANALAQLAADPRYATAHDYGAFVLSGDWR